MDAIEQLMGPQTEQARARRVLGLVTARVRRIDDDGAYRLEYLTMGDAQLSAPARVMMPMAGAQRGIYCLPEVGDEVVVAFELGDTNLPVILGAVWNNDSPPPDQAKPSPDNNIRTLVSRSGHELTFDDTPGAERITLKSQGGNTLTLDDTPGLGKVALETNGGRTLVLDDTPPGSVSLSSAAGVQIQFSDAAGTLLISAPLAITIQSATITLQANALNISAVPAMVLIGGSPFGLHVHVAPPPAPPAPFTGPVLP
jgi:phage baseplate assembly protein gpV